MPATQDRTQDRNEDRNGDSSAAAREGAPLRTERGAVFAPLYRQIKQLLMASLEQGEWKPGELIPSEIELAARFQVSQGTVRKAIDEMAAEHLLLRRQGKGTFVATHHEPRAQYRFLRLAADDGELGPSHSQFLDCRRQKATREVAVRLDLKAGEPVVYVRRLLLFGERPVVLDELWLPGTAFKGLSAERLAKYHGPLYGLFETEFGTRMIRADERIQAVAAQPGAAQLLQVEEGSPLLEVERLSYTYGDRPVELRRGLYVTTVHHYRNTLT
jgi:GntR family transcriptional regulator